MKACIQLGKFYKQIDYQHREYVFMEFKVTDNERHDFPVKIVFELFYEEVP